MGCDLSIVIPAIRQNRWRQLVNSVDIKNYSFEMILISPFDWPDKPEWVRMIKSYDTPSVATQKGFIEARGDLIYLTVDDCVFFPGAIDKTLKFYEENCEERDVINGRYRENANFTGHELPPQFWTFGFHQDLRLKGIPQYWKISLQPIINKEYLLSLGGIDCQFTYSNHSLHDLALRIQRDGGKYYDSPVELTSADHYPAESGDHKPIHNAQNLHDKPLFEQMYSEENYRIKIPLDNYKQYEGVWKDRFKTQYNSYQELANGEGYNI